MNGLLHLVNLFAESVIDCSSSKDEFADACGGTLFINSIFICFNFRIGLL